MRTHVGDVEVSHPRRYVKRRIRPYLLHRLVQANRLVRRDEAVVATMYEERRRRRQIRPAGKGASEIRSRLRSVRR